MIRKQLTYPPVRPRQGGAGSLGLGVRRSQTLLGLTSASWASVSPFVNEAVGPNDLEGFSRGPLGWSCFLSRPPLTKANRRDAPSPGLRAGGGGTDPEWGHLCYGTSAHYRERQQRLPWNSPSAKNARGGLGLKNGCSRPAVGGADSAGTPSKYHPV